MYSLTSVERNTDFVFLEHVHRIINEPTDIVNFDGPIIKAMLGNQESTNVILIGDNLGKLTLYHTNLIISHIMIYLLS